MSRGKILIVDDEAILTESLQNILSSTGYDVTSCLQGEDFLSMLTSVNPDLVLLDIFMGKVNGLQLLRKMKEEGNDIPVLMMTGHADVGLAVEAMKEGALDFVLKPFELAHLSVLIEKAMEQSQLKRKVKVLQSELEEQRQRSGIIGKSPALHRVLDTAEKLAQSDNTTVLLEGESGTGKELLARFIYQKSPRADKAFITVNCGAIPKNLAESEFFGYEKGAFTGATDKMRQGKFELADDGTIFLDEIGELSLDMQVKLLRVLEDRRFYRLGGTRELKVNVRVIAASNRDLAREVQEGRFREDLFYRLNVASVKVPPLRERIEDIGVISYAFLQEFSKKFSKETPKLSDDALSLLQNLQWKGNIRELRNAIERVVLLTSGPLLTVEHFAFLEDGMARNVNGEGNGKAYRLEIPSAGVSMGQVVRDLILKTLIITNGNQVHAAKILGLTRSKLRYRMDQLGIHPEQRSYRIEENEVVD
ncbi:MAG: sigma-54-dependent Fis family transcriptional regulator [Bacteroidetes bacterium]|nr:sigma-54-dependent Fis family transcriptional regulator [Bacteroidota bacterium]MCW5895126.1 sigma-54-dependent Fis family transcriptional regulator [Bacteroidota bacterium]